MKITPEHYEHLRSRCELAAKTFDWSAEQVQRQIEIYRAAPEVSDPEKRVRWNLLWAARLSQWLCENVYPYANDDHIDTALKQIMLDLKLVPATTGRNT